MLRIRLSKSVCSINLFFQAITCRHFIVFLPHAQSFYDCFESFNFARRRLEVGGSGCLWPSGDRSCCSLHGKRGSPKIKWGRQNALGIGGGFVFCFQRWDEGSWGPDHPISDTDLLFWVRNSVLWLGGVRGMHRAGISISIDGCVWLYSSQCAVRASS